MKKIATILALIANPALSGTPLAPPSQYLGPIAAGEMIEVYVLNIRGVRQMCAEASGQRLRFDLEGCAVTFDDGACVVYAVDNPRRAASREQLVAHEVAHCRGWPAHHPL